MTGREPDPFTISPIGTIRGDDAVTFDTCPDDDHRPDPDGTHCLRCGILAEPAPLSADALFLLTLPRANVATFPTAIGRANDWRRDAVTRARLSTGDLAGAAALYGIVGGPLPLTFPDRMRENVTTFGAWRAQAINAHAWRVWQAAYDPADHTHPDRELNYGYGALVDFRGWPGDIAADYDASAERFELSPSGRWYGAQRPPLYAAEATR